MNMNREGCKGIKMSTLKLEILYYQTRYMITNI